MSTIEPASMPNSNEKLRSQVQPPGAKQARHDHNPTSQQGQGGNGGFTLRSAVTGQRGTGGDRQGAGGGDIHKS